MTTGPFGVREDVSVLIATYAGETAHNLAESLESLFGQTVLPGEIVLVVDGPVDAEQEALIRSHVDKNRRLVVIRRQRAGGLAVAMNEALAACKGTLLMRMDSDDVCEPDRIAIQTAYMDAHPEVDMVCSWAEEFFDSDSTSRLKVSPVDHDDVVGALRWRNVLVHPTVAIRRSKLVAVNGYRTRFGLLEDYDLFVRLVLSGARLHVIPKVLVKLRSSLAQSDRRGGLAYVFKEVAFRFELARTGFLSLSEFIVGTVFYAVFRLVSPALRRRLYVLVRS